MRHAKKIHQGQQEAVEHCPNTGSRPFAHYGSPPDQRLGARASPGIHLPIKGHLPMLLLLSHETAWFLSAAWCGLNTTEQLAPELIHL
jgi:hypothetical protein